MTLQQRHAQTSSFPNVRNDMVHVRVAHCLSLILQPQRTAHPAPASGRGHTEAGWGAPSPRAGRPATRLSRPLDGSQAFSMYSHTLQRPGGAGRPVPPGGAARNASGLSVSGPSASPGLSPLPTPTDVSTPRHLSLPPPRPCRGAFAPRLTAAPATPALCAQSDGAIRAAGRAGPVGQGGVHWGRPAGQGGAQ